MTCLLRALLVVGWVEGQLGFGRLFDLLPFHWMLAGRAVPLAGVVLHGEAYLQAAGLFSLATPLSSLAGSDRSTWVGTVFLLLKLFDLPCPLSKKRLALLEKDHRGLVTIRCDQASKRNLQLPTSPARFADCQTCFPYQKVLAALTRWEGGFGSPSHSLPF